MEVVSLEVVGIVEVDEDKGNFGLDPPKDPTREI